MYTKVKKLIFTAALSFAIYGCITIFNPRKKDLYTYLIPIIRSWHCMNLNASLIACSSIDICLTFHLEDRFDS